MKKLITIINISILLTLLFGCAGPTTQRLKPDDAAVALEAEKQREIELKAEIIPSSAPETKVSFAA